MKFIGRGKADSPPPVAAAVGAIGGSDRKGRQGKALRRLVPTLVVLGLLTAFTKPGRRVTRMLARRIDDRVECFTGPGSETYVRFFAPLFERLYKRVAEDAAREMSVRRLGRGGTVVDIGCGPGDLVVAISRRLKQARIVGIDLSASMLLWAGRHATTDGRIKFIVGDGADLPFDDASVDLVVSTLSLHHWDDPAGVFAEVARVLRPGGVALIYDLGLLTFTEAEMAVIAVNAGLEPEEIVRERAHGGVIPSLFVRYRVEGLD
jgi:SAM-dependent methyltransferase